MHVTLDPDPRASIERHGEASYPDEGCGLLLGTMEPDRIRIREARPVANARREERHKRYRIAPETVLQAERDAEAHGWGLVGFFHSHPDVAAVPSDYDLAHAAWPGYVYVIVAVRDGQAGELRAWQLAPDRDRFEEVPVPETSDRSRTHRSTTQGGIDP